MAQVLLDGGGQAARFTPVDAGACVFVRAPDARAHFDDGEDVAVAHHQIEFAASPAPVRANKGQSLGFEPRLRHPFRVAPQRVSRVEAHGVGGASNSVGNS